MKGPTVSKGLMDQGEVARYRLRGFGGQKVDARYGLGGESARGAEQGAISPLRVYCLVRDIVWVGVSGSW